MTNRSLFVERFLRRSETAPNPPGSRFGTSRREAGYAGVIAAGDCVGPAMGPTCRSAIVGATSDRRAQAQVPLAKLVDRSGGAFGVDRYPALPKLLSEPPAGTGGVVRDL